MFLISAYAKAPKHKSLSSWNDTYTVLRTCGILNYLVFALHGCNIHVLLTYTVWLPRTAWKQVLPRYRVPIIILCISYHTMSTYEIEPERILSFLTAGTTSHYHPETFKHLIWLIWQCVNSSIIPILWAEFHNIMYMDMICKQWK